MHAKLPQSCLTLCDPMDCSLPGSSVYGILQARILLQNGLSCPPPGDLPDPRIEPTALMSPALAGGFFTSWALRISTKKKKIARIFIRLVLNLLISLRRIYIFTILSLPTHEHGISLHLIGWSLISFITSFSIQILYMFCKVNR